jgi:(p)ppGpp synthase/HD superfamily hydrolase
MGLTEFDARAQTNLQLYAQLLDAGHAAPEVGTVRDAYTVAAQLFAGQLRPEGRPFICHVVGVASVLAMVDAPLPMVIAGLLHSAYTHGDFGMGRGEINRAARTRLRAAVGAQIEALAAGYSSLSWDASTVAHYIADAGTLTDDVRQVIVIRLANAIEDALDEGLQLSRKTENPHREIAVDDLARLAAVVGHLRLASALRSALDPGRHATDFAALRESRTGSYLVCPSSWRERMLPRFVRLGRRLRAGL